MPIAPHVILLLAILQCRRLALTPLTWLQTSNNGAPPDPLQHVQKTRGNVRSFGPKSEGLVQPITKGKDYYLFSVQSVNGKKDGGCSETILLDTRWSKAAKVTATPGVVVGTTLATPFVGGAAAAAAVWDKIEPQNPVTGLLTSVLSIGAGLLAGAASVVIAPVVGVAAARELHDEKCHSPQSPEER
ncbi:hypothetical protein EMCRGX_G002420 [Ephydatia muelleri]